MVRIEFKIINLIFEPHLFSEIVTAAACSREFSNVLETSYPHSPVQVLPYPKWMHCCALKSPSFGRSGGPSTGAPPAQRHRTSTGPPRGRLTGHRPPQMSPSGGPSPLVAMTTALTTRPLSADMGEDEAGRLGRGAGRVRGRCFREELIWKLG